jgi:hypothetical protein
MDKVTNNNSFPLIRSDENLTETPQKTRKRHCDQNTSRIVKMMSAGPKTWIKLERNEQFEMLGYHHDSTKLLFVEDYTLPKGYPIKPKRDYLWEDINLSKKQSFPVFQFQVKKICPRHPAPRNPLSAQY